MVTGQSDDDETAKGTVYGQTPHLANLLVIKVKPTIQTISFYMNLQLFLLKSISRWTFLMGSLAWSYYHSQSLTVPGTVSMSKENITGKLYYLEDS